MSSITQKPYSPASSTTHRRFETLDAYSVPFQRDPHGARPATSEGLDRPVVARLLRVDHRTGPDEIGGDEVLQLQRSVADQDLLRRDPVFAGKLLAQRRVTGLLAVLQYDAGIRPDRRVETST